MSWELSTWVQQQEDGLVSGHTLLWAHNSHRATYRPSPDSGEPSIAPAFTRLTHQVTLRTLSRVACSNALWDLFLSGGTGAGARLRTIGCQGSHPHTTPREFSQHFQNKELLCRRFFLTPRLPGSYTIHAHMILQSSATNNLK